MDIHDSSLSNVLNPSKDIVYDDMSSCGRKNIFQEIQQNMKRIEKEKNADL